MTTVLFADYDYPDIELERELFREAGAELVTAQCKTEDAVIAHVCRNVVGRVIAYDPYLIDGDFPPYVERIETLRDLATQADVVSVHTPLTDETRGMVDGAFFSAVKRGLMLVNTSRGAVVNI